VAIFSERESHAVFFLQEQEMTRYDAINFISHGTAERPGLTESRLTLVEEEPLLQFFAYEHLPEHLKEHSKAFGNPSRIRPAGQRMGNQNSYRRGDPEPRSVG
jgi:hypothetical protein